MRQDDAIAGLTLAPSSTLMEAMGILERTGVAIAFVIDGQSRLLGTLTDGDIRRALLRGARLDAEVDLWMCREFVSVNAAADRAWVLDIMRSREVQQVPALDGAGRLVQVHFLRNLLGWRRRNNWAVVMAGGQGQRLRPITESIPKPLVRVAGRPIIERLVLHLVGVGIREIYVAVNYLGQMIQDYLGDGAQLGCHIKYLRETEPLGTGGALTLLPAKPASTLLVLNGDLVTQADFGGLLDFHDRGDQAATLAVRRYVHEVPFGCVALSNNLVTGIEEKPCLTRWVNAGIYALAPQVLDLLIPGKACTMPDVLSACLSQGATVRSWEAEGEWMDVGNLDQLRLARGFAATGP